MENFHGSMLHLDVDSKFKAASSYKWEISKVQCTVLRQLHGSSEIPAIENEKVEH